MLCIALLVLSSGLVLGLVLEDQDKPTATRPIGPPPEPALAAVATMPRRAPTAAPLPRHRLRSSVLLLLLLVLIGVLVAAAIGIVVGAIAMALRSTITS